MGFFHIFCSVKPIVQCNVTWYKSLFLSNAVILANFLAIVYLVCTNSSCRIVFILGEDMNLRSIRKIKGLTQEHIARTVGITLTYYRDIEKNKSLPTVKIALSISKCLNVSIYDIDDWN